MNENRYLKQWVKFLIMLLGLLMPILVFSDNNTSQQESKTKTETETEQKKLPTDNKKNNTNPKDKNNNQESIIQTPQDKKK